MSDASLSIILEAIMFTSGRSMSTDELSKTVDESSEDVKLALSELQARIKRRQDFIH
jgi:chromosome segregation and condensation protein ScpB